MPAAAQSLARFVPQALSRAPELWRSLSAALRSHPTQDELERFLLGRLSGRAALRIVLHLLPGCSRCRRVTSALWRIGGEPRGILRLSGRFRCEAAVARVLARVREAERSLAAERAAAPGLVAELEARPELVGDARYHTWGVCDLLLREGRAGLALTVAGLLDPAVYPAAALADLTARCREAAGSGTADACAHGSPLCAGRREPIESRL